MKRRKCDKMATAAVKRTPMGSTNRPIKSRKASTFSW